MGEGTSISLDEAVELTRSGDIWLFRGGTGADRAIQLATNAPVKAPAPLPTISASHSRSHCIAASLWNGVNVETETRAQNEVSIRFST